MFKLILSNGKEIKEVWKDYNIIWTSIPRKEFELFNATIRIDGNSIIFENMSEEALSMISQYNLNDFKEKFGAIQIINTMYDTSSISFLYASLFANRLTMVSEKIAESLKRHHSIEPGVQIKLFYGPKTIPEEIPPVNSGDTESPASSEADVAPEPESPPVETPPAPPKSKQHFATENIEFFNAISYISVIRIGRDWDSFEVEGVEVSQSDGRQSYNDFTINNKEKIAEVQRATQLRPYGVSRFNVKKYRIGVAPQPAPVPESPKPALKPSKPSKENALPSIPGKRDVINYIEMDRKTEFRGVLTYQTSSQLFRDNYHLYIQSSKDMNVNVTFEKIGAWGATDIIYEKNNVRTNQEVEINVNTLHSFTQISIHAKELSALQQIILSTDRIIE